ncbi:conserved hypothetical protein [Ricinus communis]|uniref:Uncharacterized protein n=1 Tax=Ricinus communis TaxID=3988 RepID=B9S089_RICCO|nr:conserved hypothetical protein [Ricinus communis]
MRLSLAWSICSLSLPVMACLLTYPILMLGGRSYYRGDDYIDREVFGHDEYLPATL